MTVGEEAGRPVLFCSHASADKPRVLAFAERLRGDGFDAWVDKWEMTGGENLVADISDGLQRCGAGLVFFSSSTPASLWVDAEVASLLYRAIQGLRVIPILLDDDAPVPALFAHYLRRHISEYEAVRDALLGLRDRPPLKALPERDRSDLLIRLSHADDDADARIHVEVWHGAVTVADELVRRPALLDASYELFSFRGAPSEQSLAELGEACGKLLLPGAAARHVVELLAGQRPGDRVDVVVEAPAQLLGLPFEAARLPVAGRPLLIAHDGLTLARRPPRPPARLAPAAPGPLKLLGPEQE
jgi:hypothetical protein